MITEESELAPNVYAKICPSRQVLAMIGEKWVALVVVALDGNTLRFGELKRQCEGISQKMLTQTLRKLERDGLVSRANYTDEMVLRVEYKLTELGKTLVPVIKTAIEWAQNNLLEIERERVKTLTKHSE